MFLSSFFSVEFGTAPDTYMKISVGSEKQLRLLFPNCIQPLFTLRTAIYRKRPRDWEWMRKWTCNIMSRSEKHDFQRNTCIKFPLCINWIGKELISVLRVGKTLENSICLHLYSVFACTSFMLFSLICFAKFIWCSCDARVSCTDFLLNFIGAIISVNLTPMYQNILLAGLMQSRLIHAVRVYWRKIEINLC